MFEDQKALGEKAFAQLTNDAFHWSPDGESNSIAVIIQHLTGNMRSRWTEFFTSDLEKPDRHRDTEFEPSQLSTTQLLAHWDAGWRHVFDTMRSLVPEDLTREVVIRGEPHTVTKAIVRQISHYGYHVGQIVYIAKHLRGEDWQTLSIARGRSKEYKPTAH